MQGVAELEEGEAEAEDDQEGHEQPRPAEAAAGLVLECLQEWHFRYQSIGTVK